MKKLLLGLLLALVLLLAPTSAVLALTSQSVEITVTPSYISISNAPASYNFGTIAESATPNTGTGHFTVTNSSTVNVTMVLSCETWSGTSAWVYGAPAADQGNMDASNNTGAYNKAIPTSGNVTLDVGIVAGADVQWEVRLNAPTSFTHGAVQTSNITILAWAN